MTLDTAISVWLTLIAAPAAYVVPLAQGIEPARDTSAMAGNVAVAVLPLMLLAADVRVAARVGGLPMRPGPHEMPGMEVP